MTYDVSWTASDPSGVHRFNRWKGQIGDDPDFLGWWPEDSGIGGNRFTDTLNDYDDDCGGGSQSYNGWGITAYDGEDNARWDVDGRIPVVTQENGDRPNGGTADIVDYQGAWSGSPCTCASGGRQAFTTQSGASATIDAGFGQGVALVMATGPGRSRAAVLVDGSRVDTIDTRAAVNRNRVVVWETELAFGPDHEVEVRNLATPGRPRIDLDAVVFF